MPKDRVGLKNYIRRPTKHIIFPKDILTKDVFTKDILTKDIPTY